MALCPPFLLPFFARQAGSNETTEAFKDRNLLPPALPQHQLFPLPRSNREPFVELKVQQQDVHARLAEEITRPYGSRFLTSPPKDLKATKLSKEVYRALMTHSGDEFAVDGTIAKWDGRKYYSKIEVPTLVLVGRYDFFLEASREMADRIVPAHLRVLPRSSHMTVLEQPREFLNAIREFLVDVTGD